ncbi:MAG TPA: tetratricopeptide repeat protein [Actinomycetota bacterium]|jgi:tetratricopeptide (TPR) repeat protein
MDLAARFTELRTRAGLTKVALAKPKYTGSYVTQIEAGRRTPSPEAMAYFAERLGTSPEYLATGVPEGADRRLGYRIEQGRAALRERRLEPAERTARETIQEAAGYGLATTAARGNALLGDVLTQGGRVREAIEAYEEALDGSLPSREAGIALVGLGAAYRTMGDLAYAVELLEGHLNRRDQGPLDPTVAVAIHAVLVSVYVERGDIHRAERAAGRALSQADETIPVEVRAGAYWNASQLFAEMGKWDEALDLATRARVLMEELDDQRNVARLHNAYAFLCLETNPPRLAEAREHLDRAQATLERMGREDDLAFVEQERARLAYLERSFQEALDHVERAIDMPSQDGLERARSLLLKGRVLRELGRTDEAKPTLHEAAAVFERHGGRQEAALCWRELGEIELDAGNVDGGVEAMRAGLGVLEPSSWSREAPGTR